MLTMMDARTFTIHAQRTAAGFHAMARGMIAEGDFARAVWFQGRARHWHVVASEWLDALREMRKA